MQISAVIRSLVTKGTHSHTYCDLTGRSNIHVAKTTKTQRLLERREPSRSWDTEALTFWMDSSGCKDTTLETFFFTAAQTNVTVCIEGVHVVSY